MSVCRICTKEIPMGRKYCSRICTTKDISRKYRVKVKKLSKSTLAWLSGLLEGEGSFQWSGSGNGSPSISVQMTDEDVIEKVSFLWQRPMYSYQPRGNRKLVFKTSIHGQDALHFMRILRSWMGQRRRQQIDEVLLSVDDNTVFKNLRVDDNTVRLIRKLGKSKTQAEISAELGIRRHVISGILSGRYYRKVV